MKTTKRIIFERLQEKEDASEDQAREFVDDLFPDTDWDVIVETTDEDMEDEAVGEVGETYYQ